jgi:hypothetical protein
MGGAHVVHFGFRALFGNPLDDFDELMYDHRLTTNSESTPICIQANTKKSLAGCSIGSFACRHNFGLEFLFIYWGILCLRAQVRGRRRFIAINFWGMMLAMGW